MQQLKHTGGSAVYQPPGLFGSPPPAVGSSRVVRTGSEDRLIGNVNVGRVTRHSMPGSFRSSSLSKTSHQNLMLTSPRLIKSPALIKESGSASARSLGPGEMLHSPMLGSVGVPTPRVMQRNSPSISSTQRSIDAPTAPTLTLSPPQSVKQPLVTLLNSMEVSVDRMAHIRGAGTSGAPLVEQNHELRSQLHKQNSVIARLSNEVDAMRGQLREILMYDGVDTHDKDVGAQKEFKETQIKANAYNGEVERLQHLLIEEKCRQESATQEWLEERKKLQKEINHAKALLRSREGTTGDGMLGAGVHTLRSGVLKETTPVNSAMLPFNPSVRGANLSFSEDNYTASRIRGCRQSVGIGSGPLVRQKWGWYFEVTVQETVAGWIGGLGIGMTRTAPEQLERVPDKAWRIPDTYLVGYWGCAFLAGTERRVPWCSDSLQVGSHVGVLITSDGGDFIVFVDGKKVVRVDKAVMQLESKSMEKFYPVIDVFAATRVVTLAKFAQPPEPPWDIDLEKDFGSWRNSTITMPVSA